MSLSCRHCESTQQSCLEKVRERDAKLRRLEDELSQYRASMEEYQRLKRQQREVQEARKRLSSVEQDAKEKATRMYALEQEMVRLRSLLSNLERELEDSENKLCDTEADNRQKEERLLYLESKNKTLATQLDSSRAASMRLADSLTSATRGKKTMVTSMIHKNSQLEPIRPVVDLIASGNARAKKYQAKLFATLASCAVNDPFASAEVDYLSNFLETLKHLNESMTDSMPVISIGGVSIFSDSEDLDPKYRESLDQAAWGGLSKDVRRHINAESIRIHSRRVGEAHLRDAEVIMAVRDEVSRLGKDAHFDLRRCEELLEDVVELVSDPSQAAFFPEIGDLVGTLQEGVRTAFGFYHRDSDAMIRASSAAFDGDRESEMGRVERAIKEHLENQEYEEADVLQDQLFEMVRRFLAEDRDALPSLDQAATLTAATLHELADAEASAVDRFATAANKIEARSRVLRNDAEELRRNRDAIQQLYGELRSNLIKKLRSQEDLVDSLTSKSSSDCNPLSSSQKSTSRSPTGTLRRESTSSPTPVPSSNQVLDAERIRERIEAERACYVLRVQLDLLASYRAYLETSTETLLSSTESLIRAYDGALRAVSAFGAATQAAWTCASEMLVARQDALDSRIESVRRRFDSRFIKAYREVAIKAFGYQVSLDEFESTLANKESELELLVFARDLKGIPEVKNAIVKLERKRAEKEAALEEARGHLDALATVYLDVFEEERLKKLNDEIREEQQTKLERFKQRKAAASSSSSGNMVSSGVVGYSTLQSSNQDVKANLRSTLSRLDTARAARLASFAAPSS